MPDPARIAARMDHITASGIRKVFNLAANLTDPIDLRFASTSRAFSSR